MKLLLDRVGRLLLVMGGVSFLVFLLLDLLPGDTAEVIVSGSGDPSPGAVEAMRAQLGLDRPVLVRYVDWVFGATQGDLGTSYRTGQEVSAAILERLPVTFQLILMVEVLALLVAVPLVMLVATRRDGILDRVVAGCCFAFQAIPNFMFALLAILLFSVTLRWLPALGYVPATEDFGGSLKSLAIPTMALAAGLIPVYVRVLRNEMIRTLQEDFILVGRALGLPKWKLLLQYALRPSLPTLITVVGVNIGTLVGGTVIVEVISGVPGTGTLLLDAINSVDYVLVQGIVLVIAATYVLANFAVDLINVTIDPRMRG
ncbi:ABC transporter permease [Arthrobacter ginkgonis]|uniref:ABC transporter permease n=1 Tax=Arthrobacter ginkgonis TaxID=1630594 RepID=A0ABP7DBQ1_9MICC